MVQEGISARGMQRGQVISRMYVHSRRVDVACLIKYRPAGPAFSRRALLLLRLARQAGAQSLTSYDFLSSSFSQPKK
jgi:hypothetical protein